MYYIEGRVFYEKDDSIDRVHHFTRWSARILQQTLSPLLVENISKKQLYKKLNDSKASSNAWDKVI